jgi:DNA-binding MarR family transcriptional regulator/N-acetylglutamate synthase-like GNAT family acetyltransferase
MVPEAAGALVGTRPTPAVTRGPAAPTTDAVAEVRSFNRAVGERIGLLRERFLGQGRPYGQSRLLWEIGPEGCELRALRARLDLDSGYLSRSIAALQAADLVTVAPSPEDRRIRVARLTRNGIRECRLLDERSDALAEAMLAPLGPSQRERLVDAMRTVERLLTASLVDVRVVDPLHADAQRCLAAYFGELEQRSGAALDPATLASAEPQEMREPAGAMLVAYLRGQTIGCGAVKLRGGEVCEIKRMWVDPAARGLGLGRRMLGELESLAVDRGARTAHLETSKHLREAIGLYRSAGYAEVPAFNDEPFADHWFEKRLALR